MTSQQVWVWIIGFILLAISIVLEIRHRKRYKKERDS